MIVRTEAVALRGVNYGETSQIVTLYTQRLGTIAVMARGARGGKSRFGSALQPMSHLQAVFYHKPSREIHSLSEATLMTVYRQIPREIGRMSIGLHIVESLGILMPRPEANTDVFQTVVDVLQRLDTETGHWQNLLPYFQLQLSAFMGFAPSLDKDQIERVGDSGGFLQLEYGAAMTSKPNTPAIPASRQAIRALGILLHADVETVLRMNAPDEVLKEVGDLVETYLRYHVEDFRQSRSKLVFEHMRTGLADQ